MDPAGKPPWHQATALVSLSVSGAITGFAFVPHAAADLKSPTGTHIRLMALRHAAQPARVSDATLRAAIVDVAQYYRQMAAARTPAEMEEIIWQHASIDGVDHGASCAAFASLTLESAAQVLGQQSWVTGGTSYPWPLHKWADVRVDPNPASLGIVSILQDAQAHDRWHPLGDGYQPLPGDWVLFDGHVEVVTRFAQGVLQTIGADSLPDFSVNAHEFRGPLAAEGVAGFVNNGDLSGSPATADGSPSRRVRVKPARSAGRTKASPAKGASAAGTAAGGPSAGRTAAGGAAAGGAAAQSPGGAAIPGLAIPGADDSSRSGRVRPQGRPQGRARPQGTGVARRAASSVGGIRGEAVTADVPGAGFAWPAEQSGSTAQDGAAQGAASQPATQGATSIPGLPVAAPARVARPGLPAGAAVQPTLPGLAVGPPPAAGTPAQRTRPAGPANQYGRHKDPSAASTPVPDISAQQAFIAEIAPAAIASQRKYGVPASVTIAQAIDESGWGQSILASRDHNLFGIKGYGPAGGDDQPTQEYQNGQPVTQQATFRVYADISQSVDDHGRLLATSPYYRRPMADRKDPNAFAAALTGVYATDPDYGAKLIGLMRQYNLYRFDKAAAAAGSTAVRATPSANASPAAAPARPSAASGPVPGGASSSGGASIPGGAAIPGLPQLATTTRAATSGAAGTRSDGAPAPRQPGPPVTAASSETEAPRARSATAPQRPAPRAATRRARPTRYQTQIPPHIQNAFVAMARIPLLRQEHLYRDVAGNAGLRWELLAACDWMQCEARPRLSPVHGEKLGTATPEGKIYPTKSAALEQCADDLTELSWAVYQIDLTAPERLSVGQLASVFAAFRWGGLLKLHNTSPMEFPYSVAGLTVAHLNMRWPNIADPNTPDKPGKRFRKPFGAVPVVLSLKYPAAVSRPC